jgi:hypothetical protein
VCASTDTLASKKKARAMMTRGLTRRTDLDARAQPDALAQRQQRRAAARPLARLRVGAHGEDERHARRRAAPQQRDLREGASRKDDAVTTRHRDVE